MLFEQLNKIITKAHNHLYANEGLSNSEALEELLKLMYCKIFLEKNNKQSELESLSNDDLFTLIQNIYSKLACDHSDIFEPTLKISSNTVVYIMRTFLNISFTSIKTDTKGHILQKVMDRSYRERNGQFFTPLPVVDFIVKMIDPKSTEKGADPACGTGGFLFSALEYITKKENVSALKNLYFYEISEKITRFIKMRTLFEFENSNPNIKSIDSLACDFDFEFDYILSNPPFGSQGKVTNKKILEKYDLGKDSESGAILNNQVPDILFVEKIYKSLKHGGRAAIVLPDGNLENPTTVFLRNYLLNNVRIDAVVSLPNGTFIPYGTGVKVSVIFFTKMQKDKLDELKKSNYEIFFSKITKLGYTFAKHSKNEFNHDGTICQDYEDVVNSYKNKKCDKNSFFVPLNEVMKRKILSFSFYCPQYNNIINSIKKGGFVRLKDVVQLKEIKEKIIADKEYNYIEIADVNASSNEIFNSEILLGEDLPSRASYTVKTGDIIVAVAGNAIGTKKHSTALVTDEYNNCICTNGFAVIRAEKVSPYYLLSFLNSENFLEQVKKYKYGSAIPTISKDDLLNIVVPIYNENITKKIEADVKKACEYRLKAKQLTAINYSSLSS